jgi:hypothetical protein
MEEAFFLRADIGSKNSPTHWARGGVRCQAA